MKNCEGLEIGDAVVTLDEDGREILIFGSINTEVASQVVSGLRLLDKASKSNINLIIASGGGEEAAGWVIYDALCLSKSKIIAQCFGECMSIAMLILQGCDTRLLSPNCRTMCHNGTVAYNGPLEKVRSALKEENVLTQMYYEKLAERSNLTLSKVEDLCNAETYMSAEEAVRAGFADGVLGQVKRKRR
jgi:ATP-dependent Clp protease protease subunit